jgi:hypothetical protein
VRNGGDLVQQDLEPDELNENENIEEAAQNLFEQFVATEIGGSEKTE